jgi:tetratricopeptide (TPR) repeat protein
MVDRAEELFVEGEYAASLLLAAAAVGALDTEVGDKRLLESRASRLVAMGHQSLGHLDRAVFWSERALTAAERIEEEAPEELGAAMHTRAILHLERGQLREAVPRLEKAAELLDEAGDEHRADYHAVLLTMAEASMAMGDIDTAKNGFESVLEDVGEMDPESETHAGALNAITAKAMIGLGGVHAQYEENDKAKDYLARAIEFFDAAYGHNHPEMIAALEEVAAIYRVIGDDAAAKGIEEELAVAARMLAEAEASFRASVSPPAD